MATSILQSPHVSKPKKPDVPADFAAGLTGRCLEPILFEGDVIHFKRDLKPKESSVVLVELQGRKMIKLFSSSPVSTAPDGEVILRTTKPGYYDFLIRPDTDFHVLGVAWMLVSVQRPDRDLNLVFDTGMTVSAEVFAITAGRPDVLNGGAA
jgi:hypothetical protein